jgi:aspartyl-tRNA(Asn)/glutamyl-tRNA(Gln) amidotransferase subunit C
MRPMKLTIEQVRHVARLARLALTPDEEQRYARQLGAVLEFARALEEVDTSGVAPTAHAAELPTLLAADEPRPSLPAEVAVGAAPERDGTSIAVPRILD